MKKSVILASSSVAAWILFIIISSPPIGFMYYNSADYANLLFNAFAKEAVYCIMVSLINALAVWGIIELAKSEKGSLCAVIAFPILAVVMLLTFVVFPYAYRYDTEAFDFTASLLLTDMIIGTVLAIKKYRKSKKAEAAVEDEPAAD